MDNTELIVKALTESSKLTQSAIQSNGRCVSECVKLHALILELVKALNVPKKRDISIAELLES